MKTQQQGSIRKRCDINTIDLLKVLAAPQGFEPRYADPESAVLPLNEGAVVLRRKPDTAALSDFMVRGECGQPFRSFFGEVKFHVECGENRV